MEYGKYLERRVAIMSGVGAIIWNCHGFLLFVDCVRRSTTVIIEVLRQQTTVTTRGLHQFT